MNRKLPMIFTIAVTVLLALYVVIRLYPSMSKSPVPAVNEPVPTVASNTTGYTDSEPAADNADTVESEQQSEDNSDDFSEAIESKDNADESAPALRFRNRKLLMQHFEKHGRDMGFSSASEYEKAAAAAAANPNALHKIESDDGDDVYYVEATNEFVIVSTDGYIRTYFLPDSGIKYFRKQ